jgi:hypothetical protein
MAMYDLQPDVKWPQQLGRVIQSYAQGQEVKRQRDMQQQAIILAAIKEQRERQKAEADIKMKEAYMTLLNNLGGGGRKEGPPTDSSVLSGLESKPGARVSGWGPGGPRISFDQQRTPEELIATIAKIAAHKADFEEGSPQRDLSDKALTDLQSQLAKTQGMEVRETPGMEVFMGRDIPPKKEVVPESTPYGPRPRPTGRLGKAGVGNLGSELKKAYFPSGSLIDKPRPKVAPAEPKMWDFDPKRKPDGKAFLKMPPPPKDSQERTEYDKVMTIWFRLPTSVQWDIWNYTQSGQLTFAEVLQLQSDEVKRYANPNRNSK